MIQPEAKANAQPERPSKGGLGPTLVVFGFRTRSFYASLGFVCAYVSFRSRILELREGERRRIIGHEVGMMKNKGESERESRSRSRSHSQS